MIGGTRPTNHCIGRDSALISRAVDDKNVAITIAEAVQNSAITMLFDNNPEAKNRAQ